MVDYSQPVRTKRSQRRLYVTSYGFPYVMLDSMPGRVGTGFRYDRSGCPVDGCPWGEVEAIPVDDAIVSIEHVDPKDAVNHGLREKRAADFAAAAERENDSNPLWGMF